MHRIPNGTWVAIALVVAIGLSIMYAILGGDEPLYDRNGGAPTTTATAEATPAP